MFSETRYALNGDLRVAYRAAREGPRDIVFLPNWFTNCETLPELPSIQGWCPARCATSSSGQDSSSKTAALTSSRACPANGISTPSLPRKDEHRKFVYCNVINYRDHSSSRVAMYRA